MTLSQDILGAKTLDEAREVLARVQAAQAKNWDLTIAREAECLVRLIDAYEYEPAEAALSNGAVVELSRVVVPPYIRLNPKTREVEHVDGYTYDRQGRKITIPYGTAPPVPDAPGKPRTPKVDVPDASPDTSAPDVHAIPRVALHPIPHPDVPSFTPKEGRTKKSAPGVMYTPAGVKTLVKSVVDQMMEDLGGERPEIIIEPDPAKWYEVWSAGRDPSIPHGVDDMAPDAFAFNGKFYIGPNVYRDLEEARGGLFGIHVAAHEMAHTLSGGDVSIGLAAVVEEGAAEIIAASWLGRHLSEGFIGKDYNDRTLPFDHETHAEGFDRMLSDMPYSERVMEVLMTAIRHEGWDREAVLADVQEAFSRDRDGRQEWFGISPDDKIKIPETGGASVVRFRPGAFNPVTSQRENDPGFDLLTQQAREHGIDPTPYQAPLSEYTGLLGYKPDVAPGEREKDGWSRALLSWVTDRPEALTPGGEAPLESDVQGRSFTEIRAEMTTLQEQISARPDGAPNLRDYGYERRDDYERDIEAYRNETESMKAHLEQLALERNAARDREQKAGTPEGPDVHALPNTVIDNFDQVRAAVKDRLTPEQFNALGFFTSGNGYNVTYHLRTGDASSGNFEYRGMKASEVPPLMDEAFTTAGLTLPAGTTLYRGGGESRFGPFEKTEIGDVVVDHSFVSTSADRSLGEHFVGRKRGGLVVIDVPRRSSILVGTGIEKEVILPRNARFRVTAKEPGLVHVTYLGSEPEVHPLVRQFDHHGYPIPQPEPFAYADDTARSAAVEHYSRWRHSLSGEQQEAVSHWETVAGFREINGVLRGLDDDQLREYLDLGPNPNIGSVIVENPPKTVGIRNRVARHVGHLDSLFVDAPPLERDTLVYRHFSFDQFPEHFAPGAEIRDNGFVATSPSETNATSWGAQGSSFEKSLEVRAEVVLPEGTKAAGLSAGEVLLPRGSSFRVVSVTRRESSGPYPAFYVAVLEYIPPEPAVHAIPQIPTDAEAELRVTRNPDGTATIRGWHGTPTGSLPDDVSGPMGFGGFHFGTYDAAESRLWDSAGDQMLEADPQEQADVLPVTFTGRIFPDVERPLGTGDGLERENTIMEAGSFAEAISSGLLYTDEEDPAAAYQQMRPELDSNLAGLIDEVGIEGDLPQALKDKGFDGWAYVNEVEARSTTSVAVFDIGKVHAPEPDVRPLPSATATADTDVTIPDDPVPIGELSESYLRQLAAGNDSRAMEARTELQRRRAAPTPKFETVADAASYVADRYGYGDFTGISSPEHLATLQSVIEQVDRVANDYPVLYDGVEGYNGLSRDGWKFRGIGTYSSADVPRRVLDLGGGAWGVTTNSADGPKVWLHDGAGFEEGAGLMGEIGFTAAHAASEAAVHEMGHAVASAAGEDRVMRSYRFALDTVYAKLKSMKRAFMNDTGSIYAGDAGAEGFAELFFRLNYPGAMDGLGPTARKRLLQLQQVINDDMGTKVI